MINHNKNNILKGKSGEHYFAYEALKRGFKILSPLQEDNSYDFVLEHKGKFTRIQIKSSFNTKIDVVKKGKYKNIYHRHFFRLKKNGEKTYSAEEVDFVICFLEETKDFYIIPINIASKIKSITINTKTKRQNKFDKYKNSWELLEENVY